MVKLILKTYFLKKHGQHYGQNLFSVLNVYDASVTHYYGQPF